MEHVEKIRLPKPPKALTAAAERGGNAILRASKKIPKVRLKKPQNPFGAGTTATLRRASQAARRMGSAAATLAAAPGAGYVAGAVGGALGGPKGAAAGFAGGAALDYAATAALGLMAGRRAKVAGYLNRRKQRKAGVYKARKSLPIPFRDAPGLWMSPEKTKRAILDRAERYDRFARFPGKRPAGGKARQEIARAEAARLRGLVRDEAAWSFFGRGGDAPAGLHGAPGRAKLEQDRAKAKAATSRRTDMNNDGWIDGQKPRGAKPRKTAQNKPKLNTNRGARSATTERLISIARESSTPLKYSMNTKPAKAELMRRAAEGDPKAIRHRIKALPLEIAFMRDMEARQGKLLPAEKMALRKLEEEQERLKPAKKPAAKAKPETTGDKLRRAAQTKVKGDPQAEHAEASRRLKEALDAQDANRREGMQAAGRSRRSAEGARPKAREASSAPDHRRALDDFRTESGRKERSAQAGGLKSRAQIDREADEARQALTQARAKLDAMKEQRRLDSMPSAEQMRADNDKMMQRRMAELDAGIKAKKDAAKAKRENDAALRRVLDVGPAIGADEDPMGRKRRRARVQPISKASVMFRGQRVSRAQRRLAAGGGSDPRSTGFMDDATYDTTTGGFDAARSLAQNAKAMFERRIGRIADAHADGKLIRSVRRGIGGLDLEGVPRTNWTPQKKAYYERRATALYDARTKAEGAPHPNRSKRSSKSYTFRFEKADVTGRYVRGWANVVEIDGEPVVDVQGDIIAMDEMRKSAHDYISNAREAKAMHDGDRIGDVVESVIIDDDFAKVHGIDHRKRGWWIGMEVHDPAVRKRVASGELRAFSIGGSGKRTEIEKRFIRTTSLIKAKPGQPFRRAA